MLNKVELKCKQCEDIFYLSKRHVRYNELGYKSRQIDLCKKCICVNKHCIKQHNFNCNKCEKSYSLILTEHNFLNKNYTMFCSRKCANFRIHSDKTKENISKGVKEYVNNKYTNKKITENAYKNITKKEKKSKVKVINFSKISYCLTCKKVIKGNKKYCSNECRCELFRTPEHRNKMSITLKGKTGGLREGGGHSKVFEYINNYNNIMYLNKDEILVAKWLDSLNIEWQRNNKGFEYIDMYMNNRKFYPDFYIPSLNIYVEYKGYLMYHMIHKMSNALINNYFNLLLIFSNDKRYKNINGFNLNSIKDKNITDIINNSNIDNNISALTKLKDEIK